MGWNLETSSAHRDVTSRSPAFGQWFSDGGKFVKTPCWRLYRLFMTIFAHFLALGANPGINDEGKGILSYFLLCCVLERQYRQHWWRLKRSAFWHKRAMICMIVINVTWYEIKVGLTMNFWLRNEMLCREVKEKSIFLHTICYVCRLNDVNCSFLVRSNLTPCKLKLYLYVVIFSLCCSFLIYITFIVPFKGGRGCYYNGCTAGEMKMFHEENLLTTVFIQDEVHDHEKDTSWRLTLSFKSWCLCTFHLSKTNWTISLRNWMEWSILTVMF